MDSVGKHPEDKPRHVHPLVGKWLDPAVPRTGWVFCAMETTGDKHRICDMCQSTSVRHGHILKHADVPDTLFVGLQCAERMEDNYHGPAKRQRWFEDDLKIESGWSNRKWKVSLIGNYYLNVRGFNIAIWDKGGAGFGITIKLENRFDGEYVRNGKKLYTTLDEAKLGALTALLFARKERREDGLR